MIPFDEFGKKLDAIKALLEKNEAANEPMKLMCELVGDMARHLCEMDSAIDQLDEFTENIDCRLDLFEESLDELEEFQDSLDELDHFEDDFDDVDDLDKEFEELDDDEDNDLIDEDEEDDPDTEKPFTCTGNCASCNGGCGEAEDDDDTVYIDCTCPNCGKTFFVDENDAETAGDDVMFTCPHCRSKVKVILEYDDDDSEAEKDE